LLQYLLKLPGAFGTTHELKSFTVGTAHYSKLLIRIGIQISLQLSQGWEVFVNEIDTRQPTSASPRVMTAAELRMHIPRTSDCCFHCDAEVEEACYVTSEGQPVHSTCVICPICKNRGFQLDAAFLSTAEGFQNGRDICSFCTAPLPDHLRYRHILNTYVSRLWTFIARFAAIHKLSFEEVLKFEGPTSVPDATTLEFNANALALDDIPRLVSQQQASQN